MKYYEIFDYVGDIDDSEKPVIKQLPLKRSQWKYVVKHNLIDQFVDFNIKSFEMIDPDAHYAEVKLRTREKRLYTEETIEKLFFEFRDDYLKDGFLLYPTKLKKWLKQKLNKL